MFKILFNLIGGFLKIALQPEITSILSDDKFLWKFVEHVK